MAQSINIKTKQFRGCGFMTISRYNNSGDIIYISDKESKIISAIETKNYTIIGTFIGHNGVIWNLDISKDDKILVSCSGDMSIIIWNTINGIILKQFNEPGIPKIVSIQKNCSTNFVVIYYESISKRFKSYIKIYDLDKTGLNNENLEIENNLETEEGLLKNKIEWNEESKITIVFWIDENRFLVGTEDGTIFIKDINKETNEKYKIHNGIIKSIVFNKQKNSILTSSLDSTCKLISIENWEILKVIESPVPINFAIFNHNDRKIILAGGLEAVLISKTTNSDLNIKFYRTSDLKLLNQMSSHFGPVRYLDKSPKDKTFISASQDGTVKIYLLQDEEKNNKLENKILEENIEEFIIKKFGDALYEDDVNLQLIDESNILENVNIKIKQEIEKPQAKRIVGMPPLPKKNNENDEKFKVNNENDLFEFEKRQREDNSTIRVNNLPPDIEYSTLYYYFDQFGYIEDRGIKIKSYSDNTMAFIRYSHHKEAESAIENLNKKAIDYYIIDVEFAKPI